MKNETTAIQDAANEADTIRRPDFDLANPDKAAPFVPRSKAELLGEIVPYYAVDPVKKELFYHGTRKDTKGKVIPCDPLRLCNALEIVGHGFDANDDGYCMVKIERAVRKKAEIIALPDSEIGERESWKRMNGLGFAVSAGSGERVKLANHLLQGTKDKPRFDVLSMSGWNQGNFVLPTGEVVGDAKRNIFFNGAANLRGGFTPRGSLQGWNEGVCSLAKNNPLVMTVMGLAFSGAILELIDAEEGIGMHLYTETSSGKTTCADVAASVWGHPKRLKKSWDATPISLTNSAQAANSMMMYTDEIGAGDTRRLGKVIYATINGQSRGRGLAGGGNEETKSWLNSLLSTGELGINQFITEAGEQVKGGQEIRMLDVPADGGLYRAFDCIHDYVGPDVFAKELAAQARRDCGNAGRAFVEWLINNQAQVKPWVTKAESRLLAELPNHAAPLVRRATRKFGIIAAALEMAGEAGATPFTQAEAFDAVRAIWRRWLAVFGSVSRDDERLLEQANAILSANQFSTRFVLLVNQEGDFVGEPVSVNMMGYKRIQDDGDVFYILPHAFKDEIAKGYESKKACKIFHEAGMLERPKGHDGWTVVIARKKGRGYKMKLRPCKNQDGTEL